ncbi:Limonoid UDP-glucosyltransferase [Sesamum alatum]|uniref:Limonoid UDP-glucosyltransferase n=1 Tax=Sesamum alatum TaxID=300844 RepID=A0AAE1YSJ7_9LAMI|nr:Limonoid UDP-glucosyltransferase [Sesamum alatum]
MEGFYHSYDVYLARFKEFGSRSLKQALVRLADSGRPVDCIVFDPILPWVLDVAKELGMVAVAFFKHACAVDQIYYHVYKGDLKVIDYCKVLAGKDLDMRLPDDREYGVSIYKPDPKACMEWLNHQQPESAHTFCKRIFQDRTNCVMMPPIRRSDP